MMNGRIWTKKTMFAALVGGGLLANTGAWAKEEDIGDDGYNKTYNDESKSFKSRMKEIRSVPEVTSDNSRGGFFLGLNGNFGPVYDAEPESSSGMGVGFGIEPGYAIQSNSWNRLEFGIQIGYQSFTWSGGKDVDSTLTPLSFTPRFGYGFNLSENLMGMMRVGFGMATGQVSSKAGGTTVKTDSKTGFVFSTDYDVVYGKEKIQFVGGLGVAHYQYSFAKLGEASVSSKLNLNHINLHGGVRLAF